jgi:hypothetical protein
MRHCCFACRRLLLLEYCVEQRGELEEAQQAVETMQSRRELLAQVFSAWRDCVASQRRDGKQLHPPCTVLHPADTVALTFACLSCTMFLYGDRRSCWSGPTKLPARLACC